MHEKEDRERIQRRTVVPAGNGSDELKAKKL
jgi:hypothetical protein